MTIDEGIPLYAPVQLFRLDGKTAVVTGAGRGIGRACALALALAGAQVILVGRNSSHLDEVVREIRAAGGGAEAWPGDVLDAELPARLFAVHPPDVLVSNVGVNDPRPFLDVDRACFDKLFEVNVRSAFFLAQEAARAMVGRGGGAIVHVTSQMGHVGAVCRTVYCATKHALEGLSKAMAVELAPHGIRAVTVAPTFIETDLTRPFLDDADFRADTLSRIPIGRLGTPNEVAAAVVFLASSAASLVTGASLLVDGGWTAQ